MGIKFRCPNGHKLHVKSFLAGKKGVCPKCGVAVEIPGGSTEDDADDMDYFPGTALPGPNPAMGMPQPVNPYGFPVPAMPQPLSGQPGAARPQPIPAARPIPIPAPTALPIPSFGPMQPMPPGQMPTPFPSQPLPVSPLGNVPPVMNSPQFSPGGQFPQGGTSPTWGTNANAPSAQTSVSLGGPQPVGAMPVIKQRGKLNLGKNGTLVLVIVALILVLVLVWGILKSNSQRPVPTDENTQGRLISPLDYSAHRLL